MEVNRRKLNITPEQRAKREADRLAWDEQLRQSKEKQAKHDYEHLAIHTQSDMDEALTNARSAVLSEAIEKVKRLKHGIQETKPAMISYDLWQNSIQAAIEHNDIIDDVIAALQSMTTTQGEVGDGK